MTKKILLLALGLSVPGAAWPQSGATPATRGPHGGPETARASVMIVGVAHLVAKRDVHNSVFQDSPLAPNRQVEVADVINHLARFHPTKVLIEVPMGDTVFPNRYRRFLAGQLSPEPDERYQFGFKLAARAGDSTIYPIDTWGPTLIPDSSDSGKRITQFLTAHFDSVTTPAARVFLAREAAIERHGTYLELLRYLNTDAAIRANASFYSVLDGMGGDADNAGAAYVSQWYTRNCYIFANILSVIRPGDRAVVIIGQGHEYLLRELARLNPSMVEVNPLRYLE